MSSEKPRIRLFTEIDAVLDTRYGLLKKYYPHVVENIKLTDYLGRLIDAFEDVSYADFKKLYDARGDDALEFAVLSNIHCIITTTLHGAYTDSVELPLTSKPQIILNLWPYKFNEAEQSNLLETFQLNYGTFATVTLVNMPLAKITPDYIKENVDFLVLYNTSEWLSTQNKAFETKRIPSKKLLSPALYQERIPTPEEIKAVSANLSPFEIIHKTLAPIIDLSFVDVEAFSVFSHDFNNRIYSSVQVSRVTGEKPAVAESADDDIEKSFR